MDCPCFPPLGGGGRGKRKAEFLSPCERRRKKEEGEILLSSLSNACERKKEEGGKRDIHETGENPRARKKRKRRDEERRKRNGRECRLYLYLRRYEERKRKKGRMQKREAETDMITLPSLLARGGGGGEVIPGEGWTGLTLVTFHSFLAGKERKKTSQQRRFPFWRWRRKEKGLKGPRDFSLSPPLRTAPGGGGREYIRGGMLSNPFIAKKKGGLGKREGVFILFSLVKNIGEGERT